ncbi:hypothetical protein WME77_19185 [Sorangium sp. So ce764]|uniref:hypothetical protein n=1 Tax=Sorangium sp. So ce764 TaxID=3133320 RepID=UPI003F5EFD9C
MTNTEILEPSQQLAIAVGEVYRAPRESGEVLTAAAPSLVPINCKCGPNDPIPMVQTVPVELVGRSLQDDDGAHFLGWVYEGQVHVSDDDLRWAGGTANLPRWLRSRLGPRCVAVHVHRRDGDSATVTAEFRINNGRE